MLTTWILIFTLISAYAQEPRKKSQNFLNEVGQSGENSWCSSRNCYKRSSDESGPFWANRGKKDPSYFPENFYAEEPRWILFRRNIHDNEPFFVTRGKKHGEAFWSSVMAEKRDALQSDDETPFFAARGKKSRVISFD